MKSGKTSLINYYKDKKFKNDVQPTKGICLFLNLKYLVIDF